MPKYGGSREMSQSARPLPPSVEPSPSHSSALLATSGCRRPGFCVHSLRNSTHAGSDRRKKKCSDVFRTGFAPVMVEYGFFNSVGEFRPAQFSHASRVLVLGATTRALALDVAIRQEHLLDGIVELLDLFRGDERRLAVAQAPVDVLRELDVLRRVRRVPVIEAQVEAFDLLGSRRGDPGHQHLRRHAFRVGPQHDRRAVRVVGADEMHFVSLHPLEPHPDVGLGVLHDVADMEGPVRIGKRRRDEQAAAGRGGGNFGHREKPCARQGKRRF